MSRCFLLEQVVADLGMVQKSPSGKQFVIGYSTSGMPVGTCWRWRMSAHC